MRLEPEGPLVYKPTSSHSIEHRFTRCRHNELLDPCFKTGGQQPQLRAMEPNSVPEQGARGVMSPLRSKLCHSITFKRMSHFVWEMSKPIPFLDLRRYDLPQERVLESHQPVSRYFTMCHSWKATDRWGKDQSKTSFARCAWASRISCSRRIQLGGEAEASPPNKPQRGLPALIVLGHFRNFLLSLQSPFHHSIVLLVRYRFHAGNRPIQR